MPWDGEGGCNFSGLLQAPPQGQWGREYLEEGEAHTQKKPPQPTEKAIGSEGTRHKQERAKGRMKIPKQGNKQKVLNIETVEPPIPAS